jgi:beta-phosphoglucomutase-like phosphatase (HAD superfamily)
MPGVAELVERLHGRLPLAVASNSDLDLIELGLARIGLRDRFGHLVSASDVPRAKPWPDVYLEVCRRLGVEPRDAIGFEDSPAGVDALRAAEMTSVGVCAAGQFRLDRADHVVGWLSEVLAWLDPEALPRASSRGRDERSGIP